MKMMKTVLMSVSITLIGACVMSMSASASEGGLSFRGAMVNGGCNGLSAAELEQVRLDEAGGNGQVARDTDRFSTACGKLRVPIEARYVDMSSAEIKGRSGLITLTYR